MPNKPKPASNERPPDIDPKDWARFVDDYTSDCKPVLGRDYHMSFAAAWLQRKSGRP